MLILFFTSRRRHTRLQGDWSSDVCSSDLLPAPGCGAGPEHRGRERGERHGIALAITGGAVARGAGCPGPGGSDRDRKSGVEGKRVDLGGRRIIKKKKRKRGESKGRYQEEVT